MGSAAIELVFETHSTSEDNEAGIATGWLPGALSPRGREQARELGERRRGENLAAVFTSDLRRAIETAGLAFADTDLPILHDWRLRECDYGRLNGTSAATMHRSRAKYLDEPYPGGESWRQAIRRVKHFLDDLHLRWYAGDRILVIGHVATCWGFEHYLNRVDLPELVSTEFTWQPGWEYQLPLPTGSRSSFTPHR